MKIVASSNITVSNVNDGTITHTAYAYSADGTDRFTTVYPNLNLLKNTKSQSYTSKGTASNNSSNTYQLDGVLADILNKQLIITYNYDITNSSGTWSGTIRPTYGLGGTNQAVSNTKLSGTHKETATYTSVGQSSYGIVTSGLPAGTTVTITNLKVEFGSIATPYMPSSSEVTDNDYPRYRGEYSDFSSTSSTDHSKYSWSLIRGNTSYSHTAYAYSSDGTDGFTTVYPNLNLLDGTKDFSGTWTGAWMNDGTYKGLNVKKSTGIWNGLYKAYTVTREGDYTGSVFVKSFGGAKVYRYVNVNGTNLIDLIRSWNSDFDWEIDRFTVKNLKPGDVIKFTHQISTPYDPNRALWTAGHKWEFGSTATPWMPSASEVKTVYYPSYIGQYTDLTQADSTTSSDYTWSLIRGDDGKDGTNGTSGIIVSSVAPDSPQNGQLWQDTSTTPQLVKKWTGSSWVIWELYVENMNVNNLSALSPNLGNITGGSYTSWTVSMDPVGNPILNGIYMYDGRLRSVSIANPISTDPKAVGGIVNSIISGMEMFGGYTDYYHGEYAPVNGTADDMIKGLNGMSFWSQRNDTGAYVGRIVGFRLGDDDPYILISAPRLIVNGSIHAGGGVTDNSDWQWLDSNHNARYKKSFGSVSIYYSCSRTSVGNLFLGNLPADCRPTLGAIMTTATAFSTSNVNDRQLQINDGTNGAVNIINAVANQKYTGMYTFKL